MTQIPTSNPAAAALAPGAAGAKLVLQMQMRVSGVVMMLGYLPSEVQGILRAHFYDWLTHHRLSVLANNKLTGGRQAQKWLATRLFRFTKANTPELPGNVIGKSWAADVDEFRPGQMQLLEEGGVASSGELSFTPVWGQGRSYAKARELLKEALATKKTDLIRSSNGKLLIIEHVRGRKNGTGMRDLIIGVGTRRQQYTPRLNFRARFDAVSGQHVANISKDMDKAGTEAGREALANKSGADMVFNQTLANELRKYLSVNPGNFAAANRVARAAARNARTQYLKAARAGGGV